MVRVLAKLKMAAPRAALLLSKVQAFTASVPPKAFWRLGLPLMMAPPSLAAVLPLKVQLVTVTLPLRFSMAPPAAPLELLLRRQLTRMRFPVLNIAPPPASPVFPLKMQLVSVTALLKGLSTAPPERKTSGLLELAAWPLVMAMPDILTLKVAISKIMNTPLLRVISRRFAPGP